MMKSERLKLSFLHYLCGSQKYKLSLVIVKGLCNVFFKFRDRLTADDCVGTGYLPISAISGQGDDGKKVAYLK